MRVSFLIFATVLLATKCQVDSIFCEPDTSVTSEGQCQCDTPGNFLEPIGKEERPRLEETLVLINREWRALTSHIPSIHDFNIDGINYINDGSLDMYDKGNYLSSDLGWSTQKFISYSHQIVRQATTLGSDGRYYTAKYQGLFVFAADINITSFYITGDLGADGQGQVDGTILTMAVDGVTYKGFVKSVYGTADPSVNHLIIIEDNGEADHIYSIDTNNDLHSITGLKGVTRLYYLLFSSYKAGLTTTQKVDDTAIEAMMTSFISIINSGQRCTSNCPENCLACHSPTQCTQCDTTSKLIDGTCQPLSCEAESFLNDHSECQCVAYGKFLQSLGQLDLNDTLNILNDNFNLVTSQIPSIFHFTEGEDGNSIADGSHDMYNGGNLISTSSSTTDRHYLYYSNQIVRQEPLFGSNGRFFTAKYPGLFVLVADTNKITNFSIVGGLGASTTGEVDGVVLTHTVRGVTYKGFVKRVFGTGKPTVNHLIIIQDDSQSQGQGQGQVSHSFSAYASTDDHHVGGLQGVSRLYYLLFSSYNQASATKVDDAAIEAIMASFLSLVGTERGCVGECAAGCLTCLSATDCRQCEVDWELIEGRCVSTI